MSGTGGSPMVFPNQQGVYPLPPTLPEGSVGPGSPEGSVSPPTPEDRVRSGSPLPEDSVSPPTPESYGLATGRSLDSPPPYPSGFYMLSPPAVFPNQQGVYPLPSTPELSLSPASPRVTPQERAAGVNCGSPPLHPPSPTPCLVVSPPKSEGSFPPASPVELRGGTPPRWETPHLNQQGCGSFMSPPAVSSAIKAYSAALVIPKACYPSPRKRGPQALRSGAGSGAGFRSVRRRLQALTPTREDDCTVVPDALQSAAVTGR